MKYVYTALITILVIGLCVLSSFLTHRWDLNHPIPPVELHDTTTITDTHFVDRPVPMYVHTTDTVFAPVETLQHDTVTVALPITQAHYSDSLYDAWVSGYKPSLDSIKVYSTITTITNTVQVPVKYKPHVTFGVQLGVGAQYGIINKSMDVGPYLGVGLQYNF